MRTPADAQGEVLTLAPDGWALPKDVDSYWAAEWLDWGNEMSLIEASIERMLPQVDPRSAPDLLADYQRVLGPDPCGRDLLSLTQADQAALAYQRWTGAPNSCAGTFIAQAAAIGVTMTITEFTVSMCGLSVCGGATLVNAGGEFTYQVGLPTTRVSLAVCGSAVCGDLLGYFTPNLMECVVRTFGPAHTIPYFSYH